MSRLPQSCMRGPPRSKNVCGAGWRNFPIVMAAGMEHGVVSKVSLLMSDLPAFAHDVQLLAAAQGSAWPLLAHAGNGIAYVAIPEVAAGDCCGHALSCNQSRLWIPVWHAGRDVVSLCALRSP